MRFGENFEKHINLRISNSMYNYLDVIGEVYGYTVSDMIRAIITNRMIEDEKFYNEVKESLKNENSEININDKL